MSRESKSDGVDKSKEKMKRLDIIHPKQQIRPQRLTLLQKVRFPLSLPKSPFYVINADEGYY